MRNEFCWSLLAAASDEKVVFLTGDLGFKALEPLQAAMGKRFINAGIAEQNMVSVAAGLARSGLRPWIYSIAPFVYARPFEQIRNDLAMHDLPAVLVGNGGGYGYGVMGGTHHALEDYGALLTLRNMHVFVPTFGKDVPAVVEKLEKFEHPAYLRLGASEEPMGFKVPEYAPWRRLTEGGGAVLLAVGTVAGPIVAMALELPERHRPNLWVVAELPILELPDEFISDVRSSGTLLVVEEHMVTGGVGQMIARELLLRGESPARFAHVAADGYASGRYGSQKFHRMECGMDPASIRSRLAEWRMIEHGNIAA